ncbi:MAG: DUF294 nucleotidyltransferase-like domain-containing protein [Hydrogenophilus sp.]|nr:DUF294 nucleotidyltransferase-like domain-containing protein [Hydrogenophilus sp.]
MEHPHLLFEPIAHWCSQVLHTIDPQTPAQQAAQQMRAAGISSLLVTLDGRAVGIITDRDLRNKLVAEGLDAESTPVSLLMSAPLITIPSDAPLHRALHLMAKHQIHRLVVTDGEGKPVGIISQSDLLRTGYRSPHLLILAIESASSLSELAPLARNTEALIVPLLRSQTPIRQTVELIATLNDALVRRVVELTARTLAIDPHDVAVLLLGSQGRGEQTLVTDQDNALVYADHLNPEQETAIARFGEAISEGLLAIGFPACPGNIMTRNPLWRRSVSDWCVQIASWVDRPTPEHILHAAMIADVRPLWGNEALAAELTATLYHQASAHPLFLARMAQNNLRFPPPLGWFGTIRTKPHGPIRAGLDLKRAGLFAITDGIRLLALEHQLLLRGNTFARLEQLLAAGKLPSPEGADLLHAFGFLLALRLRAQTESGERSNVVDLKRLTRLERAELKAALKTVQRFQQMLRLHYHLDLIRN